MSNLNSLDWWKSALVGNSPAFDPNVPARGWYRARRKGEEYKPCALWYDDNGKLKWVGLRELVSKEYWTEIDPETGERDIDEDHARRLWLFIHKNPISYKTYEKVAAGEPWPDIDPTVAAHKLVNSNQPVPTSPVDEFKQKIEEAGASSDKYNEITSDEQAVQAQTLRAHLLKLHKDSDEKRKELKKPFQNEADLVDSKWMPVTKLAKTFADKIRASIAAWETKKIQAKKPPAPDDVSEKVAPTTIKGASGRAASVSSRRVAVAVTNLDALMHSLKSRPELEPLLLSLAQKILNENGDCLGISIETVAEVR